MREENGDEQQVFGSQEFYKLLLGYAQTSFTEDDELLPPIIAYLLSNGDIKFSEAAPLQIQLDVLVESRLSDRLLVIVSMAYLEDQFRVLLDKFLAKNKPTDKQPRLPFSAMAQLSFSLGLISNEWLLILEKMAHLRNAFAHKPSIQSFEALIEDEPSQTNKAFQTLERLYKTVTQDELTGTQHEKFSELFRTMCTFIQFSIDHIAAVNPIAKLNSGEIVMINYVMGFTRTSLQNLTDNNFKHV